MRRAKHGFGLLALLLAVASWAGEATIKLLPLDHYRDLGRDARERELTLKALQAHIEALAQKQLPMAQRLSVDLLELDRAGETEPRWQHATEVRVLKDITWPRISLRYALSEAGQVLNQGQADLSDMNYLAGMRNHYPEGDPLRYEKKLLDDWFIASFKSKQP